MPNDGRKIPRNLENPIDSLMYDLSEILNKKVIKENISTNTITSISLISGIISAFLIYKNKFLESSLFHGFAYFFDKVNGSHARIFNKSSYFGDMFDHISDRIRNILMVIAIIINKVITKKQKIVFFSVIFIALLLMYFHLSCQELNIVNAPKSTYLSMFNGICKCKKYINFSKYFGCGTFNLIIVLFLIYFSFNAEKSEINNI